MAVSLQEGRYIRLSTAPSMSLALQQKHKRDSLLALSVSCRLTVGRSTNSQRRITSFLPGGILCCTSRKSDALQVASLQPSVVLQAEFKSSAKGGNGAAFLFRQPGAENTTDSRAFQVHVNWDNPLPPDVTQRGTFQRDEFWSPQASACELQRLHLLQKGLPKK